MSIRILMVDDEPFNLDILRIYFKSLNYEVYEAICGADALDMVDKVNPDLILLDVVLPDISGYEVCKQLNEFTDFDTPIIFLSANTQKEAILKGLELGVFDYLTKPFDLELLEKKVNIALQHRKSNKRVLNKRLESVIGQARADRKTLCFVMVQIDQLDRIYDTLGQDAVDALVQTMMVRLKESGTAFTTISRQGSDKILAVLSNISESQDVKRETKKITHLLSNQPYFVEEGELYITINIGISVFPFDGDSTQTLIKKAEVATHTAKRSGGGNKSMFYNPDMDGRLSKRMQMESKLRRALKRNELSLVYQPKINIQSGELIGSEALVRWNDPEWGIVSPLEFIPIAEETGLIDSIGRWVIQTACEQNKKWNDQGFRDLTVAVNLSALQFENPDLLQTIVEILNHTSMPPCLLEIEITEGVLIHHAAETMNLLNEFKKLGIHISIDDFGTGYSSLSYLKKLPLDCLKIDKSFIKDITHAGDNSVVTNAIISLAQALNLKVVAEGVETNEQLHYLRNKQCHEVQGFLFSKPLSAADFETYLRSHHQNAKHFSFMMRN
ncbi:EAL domain-containing protein [Paenibacillus sp. HJGM_3]|uniref:two-component system response regulator n=1 Tax=Paenibacillus sp. HJGM_3 TaxID=3379816 RepID=UPI00385D1E84